MTDDMLPIDIPPQPVRSTSERATESPVKSVAWGRCPGCNRYKAIGLVPLGQHLVWRAHTYMTYGNVKTPCRASLTRLCEQPARVLPGVDATAAPKCRCQS